MQKNKDLKKYKRYRLFAQAVIMPLNLMTCALVGFSIGFVLDKVMKTSPACKLIFLVFGFIAGIREMMKTIKNIQKDIDTIDDE